MRKIHKSNVGCAPQDVGYNPLTIDILNQYFDKLIDEKKIMGASYTLSRFGNVFASNSLGKHSYASNLSEMKPDSIRNIGSVCKLFTAVAVMQLVEKGIVHLHQPVYDLIEEFNTELHKRIEIFHLLTHTGGIVADPGYFQEPYANDDSFWDRFEKTDWIRDILSGPLQSQVGESWNYSSAGFAILGEVIQRASGTPFKEYTRTHIIQPLALSDTWLRDMPEKYLKKVSFVSEADETFFMKYHNKDSPLFASGGIDTTTYDLNQFGNMLLNQGVLNGVRILSRKSVEEMRRNQMTGQSGFCWGNETSSRKYGLSMELVDSNLVTPGTFGHDGSGFTSLYCDPTEQFVAAWFVPMGEDYRWEPLIGARAIMWAGLE